MECLSSDHDALRRTKARKLQYDAEVDDAQAELPFEEVDTSYEQVVSDLRELFQKPGIRRDLHMGNMMTRQDNQLVIIDPVI